MSTGKFWVRTGLIICVLPFFYIIIFLLPQYNHLVLNIAAILTTIAGAFEVENLLRKKRLSSSRYIFPILSGGLPLITYLEISGIIGRIWSYWLLVAVLSLALLRGVWVRKREEFSSLLQEITSAMFIIIYPALFFSFIMRLTSLKEPSLVLLFFFSLVFMNDIMAYLAGKFLGRKSRLALPISPQKTGVGFAAGFMSSIAVALLFKFRFPYLLPINYILTGVFGAGVGLFTILGDLVESALKRSAQVKDSSGIIPGRGGILDSVDSWLLSAPLVYFVLKLISG